MSRLMRCLYCGLPQDEPVGVKTCARCGGELAFEDQISAGKGPSYLQVQMELDQVAAPASQNVERYLLITIRTPEQVPADQLAPTETGRPPLGFTAILDTSGSMQGEKIAQAKEAVRQAVNCLHEGDTISLVTFANETRRVLEPTGIGANVRKTIDSAMQEIEAGGMTALCAGLDLGLEEADKIGQETNLVLLLSDGQANVGETDLEVIGHRAFEARQRGCIVSTLGVGLDYNEALMAEIATQGGGRFYHILAANQIAAYLTGELGEVALLAARNVRIRLMVPSGATLIPLSAAYSIQQQGSEAVVSIGDIPCDTELEIPLRLALLAQPAGSKLSIEGVLTFHSPARNEINIPVNRVTVRFLKQAAFHLRDGVVMPVAERVFTQMKAASVLGVSRAMAHGATDGEKQAASTVDSLRQYALLLGEERAEQEIFGISERLSALRAAPAAAKQAVSDAFRVQRSLKDYLNDK